MNIQGAIDSHIGWKLKLSRYISRPDGSLNAATIQTDNQCELGKWLHGPAREMAGLPEYQAVVSSHARFHQAAASVVRKADTGARLSDEVALGARSDYAQASMAVVSSLTRLKSRIGS